MESPPPSLVRSVCPGAAVTKLCTWVLMTFLPSAWRPHIRGHCVTHGLEVAGAGMWPHVPSPCPDVTSLLCLSVLLSQISSSSSQDTVTDNQDHFSISGPHHTCKHPAPNKVSHRPQGWRGHMGALFHPLSPGA